MLTFRQVETAMQLLLNVPERKEGILRSRLRHFITRGVPLREGPLGRGPQPNYDAGQMYQLVIALTLTQFGLTPSTVSTGIINNWSKNMEDIFCNIWHKGSVDSFDDIDFGRHNFLLIEINGLEFLSSQDDTEDDKNLIRFQMCEYNRARSLFSGTLFPTVAGPTNGILPCPTVGVANMSVILAGLRRRLMRAGHDDTLRYLDIAASRAPWNTSVTG